MNLANKTVRDALVLYVGRGLNLFLGLGSTLIYGMVFLKTQIAVISLFEMVLNLFISLGFTWSAIGLVRFGKEEFLKNKTLHHTSSVRLGIIFPIFILSFLGVIYFRDDLLKYIGTNDYSILLYLILDMVFMGLHEHINYIFTTLERHASNVKYYVGNGIGKIGILFMFYFHVTDEISAEYYIKLNVLLLICLFLVRILYVERRHVLPFSIARKADYMKFIQYVYPQIYGFSGLYIINWVDVYYIRKYWSFDDLGAYQFLYTIFVKIAACAIIMNTLFFPKIMEWKLQKSEKLKNFIKKGPVIMILVSTVCFGIFLFIYQPIFYVFFKDKYSAAYQAFNILICALPFYFVSFLYVPVLNSFDKVSYIQIVNIISAFFNVLIDYLFIKDYGLVAAAVGTFVAYFIKFVLFAVATRRLAKYSFA